MTLTQPQMPTANGAVAPRTSSVSFLTFILRLTEPGGVTVPGDPDQPQIELDRDHWGLPHLPGTSLAGVLRELARERRGAAVATDWFGPALSDTVAEAKASRIWVLGSRLVGKASPEVLSTTRIDRRRGAAADATLRSEQVLPTGTRFEVFLRWNDASDAEVADLAALIAAWRPLIGRGVSRGRGRCAVEEVKHGTLLRSDPADLLLLLTTHGPDLARAVATHPVAIPNSGPARLLFRVPVRIIGPWRIGTGNKLEPGSREPLQLLRAWPGGPVLVPGTAIKGLLRSRAEFILRSVAGESAACAVGGCGTCWTCQVFGYGGGTDTDAGGVGRRAVVRFTNAVVENPWVAERTHIAIDRFTGGVLDGALYTAEALEDGTFTIEAELLSDAIADSLRGEIAAVARLVLDDLDDGIIGMGAAVARGYGSVSVDFGASVGELPSTREARRTLAAMMRGGGSGS